MEDELDFKKLKYALYARKSTDDESRQIRSTDDQESECRQLANRIGLHIGPPIIESKSAKKPHKRPLFRQMLNDIKKGKYDGILAWNPDRLARNMLEGGEIIDMIDEGIIKDLKFVTHHFTKDANGKMLLGMAFVLSKQYSDKLSQDVSRGVNRSFKEGKTPAPKHGYYRDKDGLYKPEEGNFNLICDAWEMRSQGASIRDIAIYLSKQGYGRTTKKGKTVILKRSTLSRLFKDPFYYGVLLHRGTGEKNDLRDIYDFKPAITEDVYNKVQQLSNRRVKPNKPHRAVFYPLKTMLQCSFCGGNMYIGPSTSKTGQRYLNARCDNKFCDRKKKAIRMKHIFNYIYEYLKEGLNFSKKEYEDYYKNTMRISDAKRERLSYEIHSKQGRVKKLGSDIREGSINIGKFKPGTEMWKVNENRIDDLVLERDELVEAIRKMKEQITSPEKDSLSIEQFLNLSKKAAVIVKSANAAVKDQICRIIFLNFTVNEEKVLSCRLKEPYATLLKMREISSGRDGGT